jgi:hypothetical protein
MSEHMLAVDLKEKLARTAGLQPPVASFNAVSLGQLTIADHFFLRATLASISVLVYRP